MAKKPVLTAYRQNAIDLESRKIGDRMRMVRLHLNLGRNDMADRIGIPRTTLKNYECKYRDLGLAALKGMARDTVLAQYIPFILSDAKAGELYKAPFAMTPQDSGAVKPEVLLP